MNENQEERQGVRLLNPDEVAARLGISVRKLWRMSKSDLIPKPVQVGGRGTRWRDTDITNYIMGL